MNRKVLGVLIGCFALGGVLSASPVACPTPPTLPATVATSSNPGVVTAFSLTCGGLTFSNFEVIDSGNTSGLAMSLVTATFDASAGMVVLSFNPNLELNAQDEWFFFTVSGGVNQVDLTNGGTTNTSIQETVCSTPINQGAGNTCTGGSGNLLGNTPIVAGGQSATVFSSTFPTTSPIYIFKDISTGHTGDTHMTAFSQSFHVIPEPMTLSLMGVGLLGLGLMRRRQSK